MPRAHVAEHSERVRAWSTRCWSPPQSFMAALRPDQDQLLQRAFTRVAIFARDRVGVSDQELAEWLLQLSARWLHAHGVSVANVQAWTAHAIQQGQRLVPLVAAAASRNDFGGRR